MSGGSSTGRPSHTTCARTAAAASRVCAGGVAAEGWGGVHACARRWCWEHGTQRAGSETSSQPASQPCRPGGPPSPETHLQLLGQVGAGMARYYVLAAHRGVPAAGQRRRHSCIARACICTHVRQEKEAGEGAKVFQGWSRAAGAAAARSRLAARRPAAQPTTACCPAGSQTGRAAAPASGGTPGPPAVQRRAGGQVWQAGMAGQAEAGKQAGTGRLAGWRAGQAGRARRLRLAGRQAGRGWQAGRLAGRG